MAKKQNLKIQANQEYIDPQTRLIPLFIRNLVKTIFSGFWASRHSSGYNHAMTTKNTLSKRPLAKKALPGKILKGKVLKETIVLKDFLDGLVTQYKTTAFIATDPISFPHRFRLEPKTCEWVGFLAALFSYGRREKILETVEWILGRMEGDPAGFLTDFHPKRDKKRFSNFVYRFNREEDLLALFSRLQHIYQEYGSIEQFFMAPSPKVELSLQEQLGDFMDRFIALGESPSAGLKFLLAHPARGGACKRLHMYLRWMVRQDEPDTPSIDLGLWQRALKPSQLMIPLDTHVAQMARKLSLTQRNANDWQTAEEITAVFRLLCPEDPIRYDFALFGYNLALTQPEKNPV